MNSCFGGSFFDTWNARLGVILVGILWSFCFLFSIYIYIGFVWMTNIYLLNYVDFPETFNSLVENTSMLICIWAKNFSDYCIIFG